MVETEKQRERKISIAAVQPFQAKNDKVHLIRYNWSTEL